MSANTSRSRTGSLSARVATALALAGAFVLGGAVGLAVPTAVAVAGALALAWGVRAAASDALARTAVGSVASIGGCAAIAGAFELVGGGNQWLFALLALAAVVVVLETVDGFSTPNDETFRLVASESASVVVVGLLAISVLAPTLGSDVAAKLFDIGVGVVTGSRIAAFWWLQVGVLAAASLLPRAIARLDALVTGWDSSTGLGAVADRFDATPSELPAWYRAAFIGQLLLASWGAANALVDGFVTARPVVGGAIDAVLLSGVVHGLLLAVNLLLCAMLSTTRIQRVVERWAGDAPGQRVAVAAGGFVTVAVGVVVAALVALGVVDPLVTADNTFWEPFRVLRTVVPLLGGVIASLLVVTVAVVAVQAVLGAVTPTGGGFAVAAALVFAGTVVAAESLPAWGVVASVALAVLVWDLGVHAVALERDLVTAAASTRTEVVHLTATALVVAVAVVLAVVVGYHVVPAAPSLPDERATAALGLVLVSVVSFAVALQR